MQQRLLEQKKSLSVEERNHRAEQKILDDLLLGAWFRKVKERSAQPSIVAETGAEYKLKDRKYVFIDFQKIIAGWRRHKSNPTPHPR